MSSDGWKVIWFGVFCVVIIGLAWGTTLYLSSSSPPPPQTRMLTPATMPASQRVLVP